jgi:hypothetical protein
MSADTDALDLEVDKNIDQIERLISIGVDADALSDARRLFREHLLCRLPNAHDLVTIADAVRLMAETPGSFQSEAPT